MRKLISYWPPIIGNITAFKEIGNATDPENEKLFTEIDNIYKDQFIETATENGIERREKLLNIDPKAEYTLEDRRFTLLTRYNKQLPYTIRKLEEILNKLCGPDGYALTITYNDYESDILVELKSKNQEEEVAETAREMLPANMVSSVRIRYNQHILLAQLNHTELGQYTHDFIRNEVIPEADYSLL